MTSIIPRPPYTATAANALTQAARSEHDFAGWLAAALATTAAQLGSSEALVAGRPGSWEADLVLRLVQGTVGWDDEYLSGYAAPADEQPKTLAEPGLTAAQLEVVGQALADAASHREARGSDGYCADCEAAPAGLCPGHEADLDKADAYRALARDLGLELQ